MSLKNLILITYGSNTHESTRKLQSSLCKMAIAKNQMIFLMRCISHKVFPRFLNIRQPLRTRRGRTITTKYKNDLLIAAKNDAKERFYLNQRYSTTLTSELKHILSNDHFNTVNNITESCREKTFIRTRSKLKNKFELILKSRSENTSSINTSSINAGGKVVKDCILNLVDDVIPENQLELLNLGPKYSVTPNKIPYMDIITCTENIALNLENIGSITESNTLRQDVANILSSAKPPKSNLTRNQRSAIKDIIQNNDIDIYPYDKGTGFVRIKRNDAQQKMYESIGNSTILKSDPTNTHIKKVQDTLRKISKEVNIPKKLYYQLYPPDAIPPRAYGQCKAHKVNKNYPFRTLVSTVGTAPHKLSEYLVKIIQPTLAKNEIMIKNSTSFVNKAKTWKVGKDEIQVSFDVVALYPSVPIKKAISNLINILNNDLDDFRTRTIFNIKHVKELIEVCLYKSYFIWNHQIHMLKDSGPIGLSLMVVLAESYLQMIESNALSVARNMNMAPITHYRYVDDTHNRFHTKEKSKHFLEILNEQDNRIQFEPEYEKEENGLLYLNFLDVQIINTKEGNYVFNIHRKEAITNVQIKPNSCHSEQVRYGVFKGFVHRAKAICSPKYLADELKFLIKVFVGNGYHYDKLSEIAYNNYIKPTKAPDIKYVSLPMIPNISYKLKKAFAKANYIVSFKSPSNLKSILTSKNKDKLPKNSYPGVYQICCECDSEYIGQTKAKVSKRAKQHEKSVFFGNVKESALAEHKITCDSDIKWKDLKTISVEPYFAKRCVRESLEIKKINLIFPEKLINKDDGLFVKSDLWNHLLKKL